TSRLNTSTAITAATASPKAARKSRSARSRASCSGIWGRGSIEWSPNNGVVPANAGTHNRRRLLLRKPSPRVPNREAAAYGSLLAQGRRGGSIPLPILAHPIGITQMAAQDLARGVARQGVEEIDRLRRL